MSAPLWGCELKYNIVPTEALFAPSAPLWGCELKFAGVTAITSDSNGQPPCGAVSLNTDAGTYLVYVKAVSPLAGL